jgi:hypothetical protein
LNQLELDDFIKAVIPDPEAATMVAIITRLVRHADNCADRDLLPPQDEMARAMHYALVDLPSNKFYQQHIGVFAPLLVTIFAVWAKSETFKDSTVPQRRAWAYAWRDGISFVLYHTAYLVGGVECAMNVTAAFVGAEITHDTETFEQWDKT